MSEAEYISSLTACECGSPIPPRSGPGRPRKYCSPPCAERAKIAQREADDRPRRYQRVGLRTFSCVQCGQSFEASTARKYCGNVCKNRAATLRDNPDAPARGPLTYLKPRPCAHCGQIFKPRLARHSTYCSRECAFQGLAIRRALSATSPGPSSVVYFKTCAECGKAWTARNKNSSLCSRPCFLAWGRKQSLKRNMAAMGVKAPRACKCCGEQFTPGYGDKRSSFCGVKCARKWGGLGGSDKPRKRARKYGVAYEAVNRIRVFTRDGWRCQICGVKTPRALMGKLKPNAPELDHRVPISKGGPHTYANVQCACRSCNIAKGNRSEAGQLPLFGV